MHAVLDEPMLIAIKTVASRLSISQRKVEKMLANRTLPSVKIGRRRLVRRADLEKLVRNGAA
jgi:excisionase family DNA binding protein